VRPDLDLDVVIVGAGPAGLAAAAACARAGVEFAVLDRGASLLARDRERSEDIASGTGGAGLFSDGKFSYYPSATALWGLRPENVLRAAYDWFAALSARHGLVSPPFPSGEKEPREESVADSVNLKPYPSVYMPLDRRIQLIRELSEGVPTALQLGSAVRAIRPNEESDQLFVEADGIGVVRTRSMVLGTGRLGPLLLQELLPPSELAFRRCEVGVRVEQQADQFFLRDAQNLDPKYTWRDAKFGFEFRTFCCCRNGEVISSSSDGLLTVCGRSDVDGTDRSNVGVLVRLPPNSDAALAWPSFRERASALTKPVTVRLDDFLTLSERSAPLANLFGRAICEPLREGLTALRSKLGDVRLKEALLYAPAIEGVGLYPATGPDLKLGRLPLWVAGDASGAFRGLTAALVSGYFAGLRATDYLGTFTR
jgi:uncharacterized protein